MTIKPTVTPFSTPALAPAMLTNLAQLGYTDMISIQAASPLIALAGHDLIAQAKAGSGKTVAFTLALLTRPDTCSFDIRAMVLCPTRKLTDQVAREIRRLACTEENVKVLTLCGGTPVRPQAASLEHGTHITVGTPGRIMDYLERGSLGLGMPKMLVLDEADRILDMDFLDNTATIVHQCPADRQTLLFSATYPEGIARLSQRILRNPKEVKLEEHHDGSKIHQCFCEVTDSQRLHAVGQLLRHYRPVSTLTFCNAKQQCQNLLDVLRAQGIHASALHGELRRRERGQVLIQFANRSCPVLVATDVAACGLDIAQLEAVINTDVAPDPEVHVRRIDRTGHVDENDWTLSLANMDEAGRIDNIEQALGRKVGWHKLDGLDTGNDAPLLPSMETLQILGGHREKIHPGDVLGALAGDAGFRGDRINKIDVTEFSAYVAIERSIVYEALRRLNAGTMKGKRVRIRLMDE